MPPLLCVAISLAGCQPGHDLTSLPLTPGREYRLGPGDIVRVITYGEDPLTASFASATRA